jgi:thioredoxin-like negative regulator of GroEL
MLRPLLAAALAAALALAPAAVRAVTPAPLAETLTAARERQAPALVHVTARWCGACAQLERDVLDAEDAAERLAELAFGAVDFDSDEGAAVTERYRVLVLPTVLLLDADGDELGRVEGYDGRAAFLRALERLRAGAEPSADALRAAAQANPRLGSAWLALGRRLLLREDPEEGRAVLDRAILADPTGELGVAGVGYELLGRYSVRAAPEYDEAVRVLAEGRVRLGGTESVPSLVWWWAVAALRGGDADGAEWALHNFTAARPYDPEPFLLRADFFEEHRLETEQIERDIGVVLSLQPPADAKAAAWHVRARLYRRLGRVAEARHAIDKALALTPEKALYLRFRAELENAPAPD